MNGRGYAHAAALYTREEKGGLTHGGGKGRLSALSLNCAGAINYHVVFSTPTSRWRRLSVL
jgi:hypothetical protein